YKGKYQLHDGNYVSAQVEVVHYSGTPDSVLGPRETFWLTLNGIINDQGIYPVRPDCRRTSFTDYDCVKEAGEHS
ncbi:MAG TPA: hypothetical protein VES92_08040, partial [Nitrospiraceae bacterium]|nr:hypothetical protein [Nitrospiraceae bacterium]